MLRITIFIILILLSCSVNIFAQNEEFYISEDSTFSLEPELDRNLYKDKYIIEDYVARYDILSKDILLAMLKDETLNPYKSSAALRLFKTKYAKEVVSKEKKNVEKILLRRLNRSESAFIQVEVMHTLVIIDRFRYFKSFIPLLIQKLDHYNSTVNIMAFQSLNDLIESGNNRSREARIVFNTLRKVLFLSKKRLATIEEPDLKLSQKLTLIRWSVKVLGNEDLKKLPKEVLNLL